MSSRLEDMVQGSDRVLCMHKSIPLGLIPGTGQIPLPPGKKKQTHNYLVLTTNIKLLSVFYNMKENFLRMISTFYKIH